MEDVYSGTPCESHTVTPGGKIPRSWNQAERWQKTAGTQERPLDILTSSAVHVWEPALFLSPDNSPTEAGRVWLGRDPSGTHRPSEIRYHVIASIRVTCAAHRPQPERNLPGWLSSCPGGVEGL